MAARAVLGFLGLVGGDFLHIFQPVRAYDGLRIGCDFGLARCAFAKSSSFRAAHHLSNCGKLRIAGSAHVPPLPDHASGMHSDGRALIAKREVDTCNVSGYNPLLHDSVVPP